MIFNTVCYSNKPPTPPQGHIWSFTVPYGPETSGTFTYGNEAAGLTELERRQEILNHIVEFGLVKWDAETNKPVVNYLLDKSNLALKQDGTAANLTGADGDVCVLYRPVWWTVDYVYHDRCTYTFATNKALLDRSKTIVTAHQYGDTLMNWLAVGRYPMVVVDGVGRSISVGTSPMLSGSQQMYTGYAKKGRNNQYNLWLPLSYSLWVILIMFECNCKDFQTKVGRGNCEHPSGKQFLGANGSESLTSNWMLGYQSGTAGVTCGGLCHAWGNTYQTLGEILYSGATHQFAFSILGGYDTYDIYSGIDAAPATWRKVSRGDDPYDQEYVSELLGDPYLPTAPKEHGGTDSTYYADYVFYQSAESRVRVGGYCNRTYGVDCGPFYFFCYGGYHPSVGDDVTGTRLQILVE